MTSIPTTSAAITARMRLLHEEIETLAAKPELTEDDKARWHGVLEPEFERLREARAEARRQEDLATIRGAYSGSSAARVDEGSRLDLSDLRSERVRLDAAADGSGAFDPLRPRMDAARREVDRMHSRSWVSDRAAERMTSMLGDPNALERSRTAAWVTAAGSEAYLRAFAKVVSDPLRGHLMWEPDEQQAFRDVTRVHAMLESRAALGTSGYVLPVSLDPAIMLTNAGAINPLREVARVVTTSTNTWRGITSGGATAEWKAEGVEAADGTPTVAEAEIATHAATVDVVWSYELEQDSDSLVSELGMVMRDAVNVQQLAAFTTGSGTGEPQGIITGLDGTASELSPATAETLAAADVYAVQNALPARFSAGASWLSNLAIRNSIAQFETTNGAHQFPELRQSPPSLLTKPWRELSQMDGTINPAATADNFVLLYGDIAKAFVIVDRIGATLELLPGYGANGRPTGQRHGFLFSRVGSEVVVSNAARVLNVATTA